MNSGKFFAAFTCCSLILFQSSFSKPSHALKITGIVNNRQDTTPVTDTAHTTKLFDKVDTEASFPGGDNAWKRFLELNLDATVAARNKAPVGTYTVIIQFVVNKEGYITEITSLTNNGYGTEDEVIRLLKTAPRWKPAIQNGRPVKAYRKQPVTFMVMTGKKKRN